MAALAALTEKSHTPRITSAILPAIAEALVSGVQPSFGNALPLFAALTTAAVNGAMEATVTGLEPSTLFLKPARFAGALIFTRE